MNRLRLICSLAAFSAGSSLVCAAMALASSGGVGLGGGDPGAVASDRSYQEVAFGSRDLRRGNRGEDVKTLNWLLRSQAMSVPFSGEFDTPTDAAVRKFQKSVGVNGTGVVKRSTRKAIASRMTVNRATWYGPGFWGHRTACGQTLEKGTIGVANKKLACGTRVTFAYNGHWVRAKVIDRGPYNAGYQWDLTRALAKQLGFIDTGAGVVRAAVARR